MNQITDTSTPDRKRAIDEAGKPLCPDCQGNAPHSWPAHSDPERCWNCGQPLERSPFDRIVNAFENWWQRDGVWLLSVQQQAEQLNMFKTVAKIAWMNGADAALEVHR